MEAYIPIISALISAGAALIVCLVNNKYQHEKALHENERRMEQIEAVIAQKIAVLDCKFDELTKKVEKHNQLVERTYKLESDVTVLQEKQRVANNRISDLEKK